MKPKGLLLVLSGPSGAGKGTICQMLREKLPDIGYSVSVTTRAPREGEVDGVSYFFKTVEEVKAMIAEGGLLEYAEVYGNYYGTPRDYVMDLLNQGKDVILEIDIQGALQIKKRFRLKSVFRTVCLCLLFRLLWMSFLRVFTNAAQTAKRLSKNALHPPRASLLTPANMTIL